MRNNNLQINNTSLSIREWNGQRVVTFKDIDLVHERPDGTARKAFNRNRKHLVKNEDYFIIKPKDVENQMSTKCPSGISYVNPRGTTFVTESGYLMIVKVFEDDLAWKVQKQLVNTYFKAKEETINESTIISQLSEVLSSINTRLSKLEEAKEQTPQIETTYKKPYNPWFAKMQPKYKLLEEYFNIARGQLYKNILLELENLYDIDTQQIQADYCYENNLTSCYPLEPYEFVPKYRDMIESIVNNNLIKYGIASESDPITSTKHITIFDTEPKKQE